MENILDILCAAESIIDNNDNQLHDYPVISESTSIDWFGSVFPSQLLEPTPIGPKGIEHVIPNSRKLKEIYPEKTKSSPSDYLLPTRESKRICLGLQHASRSEECKPVVLAPFDDASLVFDDMPEIRSSKTSLTDVRDSNTRMNSSSTTKTSSRKRYRKYQADLWDERFQDLVSFRREHGNCLVPHSFPENPHLAQWVKRQRYQYKLKLDNRHSTLSDKRQNALEELGFVWDSHKAAWTERYESLKAFRAEHGHSSVPSNFRDRQLAFWVKCQRRQYKSYLNGDSKSSPMTAERIDLLNLLDFDWNPRNL